MEFVIVMALLVILSTVIIVILNPTQQYSRARNIQRTSHVNAIAEAVRQRIIDNHGTFQTNCSVGALPTTSTQMGSGTGKYNIEPCLVPVYLSVMPLDPSVGTSSATGYNIFLNASSGIITVSAPYAEVSTTISVTR